MPGRTSFRRLIATAVLLGFAFASFSEASIHSGQSGRKPVKRPESPDPLPPKQEEPPIKPSERSANQIPVKVVWYLQHINSSSILAGIVQDGCLERLAQTKSVFATPGRDMNRKEASDMAKASSDTYVLWFELELDVVDTEDARVTAGPANAQYYYVNFEVFAPGTGKHKTSGHIYQRPRGPGGVPMPRTNSTAEFSLRYAGREMADRLLDTLNVPRPSGRD
ncbi:MAG TPA: hypothetical protein VLM38_17925 [Blastocatellia bacterium]|nr:hypothetical protein [Blastocatellia bacterium]